MIIKKIKKFTGTVKGKINISLKNIPESFDIDEFAWVISEELYSKIHEIETYEGEIAYSCIFQMQGTSEETLPSWDEDGGDPGSLEMEYKLDELSEEEITEIVKRILREYGVNEKTNVTTDIEISEESVTMESCY